MWLIDKLTNKMFRVLPKNEEYILAHIVITTDLYYQKMRCFNENRIYHKELLQSILGELDLNELDDTVYMEFLPGEMLKAKVKNMTIEEKPGIFTPAIMVEFYKVKI